MKRKYLFLLILSGLIVACGSPESDKPDGPTPTPTLGNDVDLSGTWATQIVNSQIFDGTLGSDTVVITTLSRTEIVHTDTDATTNTEVCQVELSPYLGNQTTYPAASVAAIPVQGGTATLAAPAEGAAYTSDRSVRLIGWQATDDPIAESLPDDPSDGRVVDGDGDGNPGVTLQVEGSIVSGDIYIVNRSIVELTGFVTNPDRIDGDSHTDQGQNVIGASDPLLELGGVTATPDETPGASFFAMVRVSDADDCAAIKASAGALF